MEHNPLYQILLNPCFSQNKGVGCSWDSYSLVTLKPVTGRGLVLSFVSRKGLRHTEFVRFKQKRERNTGIWDRRRWASDSQVRQGRGPRGLRDRSQIRLFLLLNGEPTRILAMGTNPLLNGYQPCPRIPLLCDDAYLCAVPCECCVCVCDFIDRVGGEKAVQKGRQDTWGYKSPKF